MPYMPTNFSPNNMALVKGEDIVFHCLVDKYDTITRAKLTLHDSYNKNDSAFVEIGSGNNQTVLFDTSSNLDLDISNTVKLPYIANKNDVSIFAIGLFGYSSQAKQLASYSYVINDDDNNPIEFIYQSGLSLIFSSIKKIDSNNTKYEEIIVSQGLAKEVIQIGKLKYKDNALTVIETNSDNYSINIQNSNIIINKLSVSSFLGNHTNISYSLEIEGNSHNVWVTEGVFSEVKTESDTKSSLTIKINPSPLVDDRYQQIINGYGNSFAFQLLNNAYESENIIEKWVNNNSFKVKNDFDFTSKITHSIIIPQSGYYNIPFNTSKGKVYWSEVQKYLHMAVSEIQIITNDNEIWTYVPVAVNEQAEKKEYYREDIEGWLYQRKAADVSAPDLRFTISNVYYTSDYGGRGSFKVSLNEGYGAGAKYALEPFFFYIDGGQSRQGTTYKKYIEITKAASGNLYQLSSNLDDMYVDIDGVSYQVTNIDSEQKTISTKESLESLASKTGQYITLYRKYLSILTDSSFSQDIVYSKSSEGLPFNISKIEWINYRFFDRRNWYSVLFFNTEKPINISDCNKYNYYFKYNDNYIHLGKIMYNNDTSNYSGSSSYQYRFEYKTKTYLEQETAIIFYDKPVIKEGSNDFYQIKSNTLRSADNSFVLVDSLLFDIQYNKINSSIGNFSVINLVQEDECLEYSQWILKKNNIIIDKSQKHYFKLEDYQYAFFEQNTQYELTLLVHDKRNIDWTKTILFKTEEAFNGVAVKNSAYIEDKAVKLDIGKLTSEFNYTGNAWEVKNNLDYKLGGFIIKFKIKDISNEGFILSTKDNIFTIGIYSNGYLEYNHNTTGIIITPNTTYWLYMSEDKIHIIDDASNSTVMEIDMPNDDVYFESLSFNSTNAELLGIEIASTEITPIIGEEAHSQISWTPSWEKGVYFVFYGESSVNGNNIPQRITPVNSWIIKRHELIASNGNSKHDSLWLNTVSNKDTQDTTYDIIKSVAIGEINNLVAQIKDYGAGQGKIYQYELVPNKIDADYLSNNSDSKGILTRKSNLVNTDEWYEINLFGTNSYYRNNDNSQYTVDKDNLWTFELDADSDSITFNAVNTPNDNTGSRYPKVTTSSKNYLSGSATMYLGTVNTNGQYSRDNDFELLKFSNFANNDAVKFLKLKNGMVIPVSITLKSSQNQSNLIGNPTKITFDWVQIDDKEKSSLIEIVKGDE